MMNNLPEQDCCGCGACSKICPKDAISFVPNNQGFYYPAIHADKCIKCSLCEKTCPVLHSFSVKNKPLKAFGAFNVDEKTRLMSSSGGVFSALAEKILEQNGIVYGAVAADKTVKHIRIEKKEDLTGLRGSKYVQSSILSVFDTIKEDFETNKAILFSGTPCQCAAIKLFIKTLHYPISRIMIVDFVCHGVMSPNILYDYWSYCEKKAGKNIVSHIFRSKANGWHKHTEANVFFDGTEDHTSFESQILKSFFHSSLCYRKSCYSCKFSTLERPSDITMGDFWGIEKKYPEHDSQKGVSFAIVNSETGFKFLETCKNRLKTFDALWTDTDQPNLYTPTEMPSDYPLFWKAYQKGFYQAAKKYFRAGKTYRFFVNLYKACFKGLTK